MNILFIFTGGTIGSRTKGDIISTDPDIPYMLIDHYRSVYGIDFSFDTISPYTILSENSDGHHLKLLADTVDDALAAGRYDGIIIAHGTDTLLFSANIVSLLTPIDSIPICFVSSAYPPEDPRANALDNLHAALNIIKCGKFFGTIVPYRNHDNTVYIHRPIYLLEAQPFNDELFSLSKKHIASFENGQFVFNDNFYPDQYIRDMNSLRALTDKAVNSANLLSEYGQILHIRPFPGMTYPDIHDHVSYILHESFHSGTINTESENARSFFAEAFQRKIPVYLTGIYEGASYESTKEFCRLHVITVREISPTAVCSRLLLG